MDQASGKLTEAGSLVDRLVVRLRDAILAGEYPPGHHIRIKPLADKYGVSMIPVREALARLLASRLVRVEANRGYFVAGKPSAAEFAQFVQFREMFELSAVALGFDNATKGDIAALRRLNRQMARIADSTKPDTRVKWGRLNGEFHLVLVGLAHNEFITEQYRTLSFDHMHFQLARAAEIEFTSLPLLVEQHNGLIAALEEQDKPLFLERLRQHINNLNLPV